MSVLKISVLKQRNDGMVFFNAERSIVVVLSESLTVIPHYFLGSVLLYKSSSVAFFSPAAACFAGSSLTAPYHNPKHNSQWCVHLCMQLTGKAASLQL